MSDIEAIEAMSDLEDALRDVERAVERVEQAVRTKWNPLAWFGLVFMLGMAAAGVEGIVKDVWHAKWRYAATYGVGSDEVRIDNHPHNCAFLAAPLGEKYCHYERIVSTVRWGTSTTDKPIISYDDGKTWSVFEPEPSDHVPKSSTVKEVYVSWEKKED